MIQDDPPLLSLLTAVDLPGLGALDRALCTRRPVLENHTSSVNQGHFWHRLSQARAATAESPVNGRDLPTYVLIPGAYSTATGMLHEPVPWAGRYLPLYELADEHICGPGRRR